MSDSIDRQAVIEVLDKLSESTYEVNYGVGECYDAINAIAALPLTEPQIIRCKDCNFWTKQKDSLQGRCALMGTYPTGNWFCGNAERITE